MRAIRDDTFDSCGGIVVLFNMLWKLHLHCSEELIRIRLIGLDTRRGWVC